MALTDNTIPVSAGVVGGKTTIEDSNITADGANTFGYLFLTRLFES